MQHTRTRLARAPFAAGLAAIALALPVLTACSATEDLPVVGSNSDNDSDNADATDSESEDAAPVRLSANVKKGARDVAVSTRVEVAATDGTLSKVIVRSPEGAVPGQLDEGRTTWQAGDLLEPGVTYTVLARGKGEDGSAARLRTSFTTDDLTLDEQTFPSVAPLAGETVGIGMPVVVNFDLPVTDRAAFERNMHVTSTPAQPGTWHWRSDTEAHWRPKEYWKPGTEVSVDIDINGVDAGNGIYGQEDREIDFAVGDAHIYRVNAQTHQMRVFENGELIRTFPITTGKEGFTTRSGVKVIMEKHESKRMNSETVGIPAGSAESYDINNVQWAMRLTSSGEFIHAAPWSVGSQGYANVSHGCTGMSTEDAAFLYSMTQRGDVVEYTGTDRPMEPDNGWGDWNVPYAQYARASAL